MMALLSGAWWAQKLTGVTAQAIAISVAAAIALSFVVGGLWWLRADARADERAASEIRTAKAVAKAEADLRARMQASEAVGRSAAEEMAAELASSEAARVALDRRLTEKQAKAVCFPAEMVEMLNR